MANITQQNFITYLSSNVGSRNKTYFAQGGYPSVNAYYGTYDSKSTAHKTLCAAYGNFEDFSEITDNTACQEIPRAFTVAIELDGTIVEYQYKKVMPENGYTASDLEKKADSVSIVTNLTTDDDTKVLSASKGKALKDLIDSHEAASNPHGITASGIGAYVKPSGGIPESDLALTFVSRIDALESDIPTKVSDLTNDSGYLTQHQTLPDIVDDVATNDAAKVLSAKQGKLLNDRVTILENTEITAEDVTYDSSETYTNGTVGYAIQNGITASAASAAAAASSASIASGYYSDIRTAIDNLDSEEDVTEAVAAQVAVNQADIAGLKSNIVVDLSTRYSTSYANLSAALTALDNDTATDARAIKKAGVSIKFINSSTNKYEQWNLKASSFSITVSDWVSVNGKLDQLDVQINGAAAEESFEESSQGWQIHPFDVKSGDVVTFTNNSSTRVTGAAFFEGPSSSSTKVLVTSSLGTGSATETAASNYGYVGVYCADNGVKWTVSKKGEPGLKNEVDSLANDINQIEQDVDSMKTVVNGTAVTTDFSEIASDWQIHQMSISDGDVLTITNTSNVNVSGVAFFKGPSSSSTKVLITESLGNGSVNVTADDDYEYIGVYCSSAGVTWRVEKAGTQGVDARLDSLEATIDTIEKTTTIVNWDNGYIDSSGNVVSHNDWGNCVYNVSSAIDAYITCKFNGTSAYCVILDADDNVLASWNNSSFNGQHIVFSNYSGAAKLAVCGRIGNHHSLTVTEISISSQNSDKSDFVSAINECDFSGKLFHFSLDDIYIPLLYLINNTPESIYYNGGLFATLKSLHDTYGVCFTLNVFNTISTDPSYDISDLPSNPTWQSEFQAAKTWLRFSFHGDDDIVKYDETDVTTFAPQYEKFVSAIYTLTGDYGCIDGCFRLSMFQGTKAILKYLAEHEHGGKIFTTRDSGTSPNYFLSPKQIAKVNNNGKLYDIEDELIFIKSQPRTDDNTASLIESTIDGNIKFNKITECFGHTSINQNASDLIAWAATQGYRFGFFSDLFYGVTIVP